jgi:hypothetical protein
MELTRRETQAVAEITAHARRMGRWPTMREVSATIGEREGNAALSLASTYRGLIRKGMLRRGEGRQWGIAGYMVKIIRADVVPEGS